MTTEGTNPDHPLRRWRAAQGFRLEDVADLAGISPTMVSFIETGQRNPGPRTQVAIARALGVRIREIFPAPPLPPLDAARAELEEE